MSNDDELELDDDAVDDLQVDTDAERGPGSGSVSNGIDPDDGRGLPARRSPDATDVELDEASADAADRGRHRARHHPGSALLHHVVTTLCVAAVLGLGVYAILEPPPSRDATPAPPSSSPLVDALKRHAAASTHRRTRVALEVYHLMEQSYPVELQLLVDRGLLNAPDVSYPWGGGSVDYQRRGNTFDVSEPPFQP